MESYKKRNTEINFTRVIKVATVNCVYNRFSTGKIIRDVESYAKPYGVTFVHCFEVGENPKQENVYRISRPFWFKVSVKLSMIFKWQYGMGTWHTMLLCHRIKKSNPDIVHIHCPNARSVNLYYLLRWLKRHYTTVITNHAEYFYTGNCAYAEECGGYMSGCKQCENPQMRHAAQAWRKMKDAFAGFDNIVLVTVSPWQKKRLDESVILGGKKSRTILNGIDTKVFCDRSDCISDKYKDLRNKKNIVCVTSRFTDKENDLKGGKYLIELAKRRPEYNFIVVGTVGELFGEIPENVHIVGFVGDQMVLAEYYSLADLSIMTSRRETFGMALAESLCCGTPVVGFKNGGSDSSALPEYTAFVDYGDVESLDIEIAKWIDRKETLKKNIIKDAKGKYSKERMGEEYLTLYREIATGRI